MSYTRMYDNMPARRSFAPMPMPMPMQPRLAQGDGSAVSLGGGGTATPENYLGDWVPQQRKDLLSSIGFGNGAGSELLSLRKQYNAEKNNYVKQDLMSKMVNAETRFNKELQGFDQEYRGLARDANYAGAKKMVDEETAAGRPTGLAAMAGNAILSNNHFSHGIINQGRMIAPAGNAVEDALKAAKLTGKMPSQGLLQALAVSDALSQDDYMPGGPFGISKSIGGSYKSMSDVGQAGGMKVYGYDDAFGGSGKQAAIQDSFDILRDHKWATDAQKSYDASMANTKPVGDYKGASGEYLSNIKSWSKQPDNLWVGQDGKLARMNYGADGEISSVSTRSGDTYTEKADPSGKYKNWNWLRSQPRQESPKPDAFAQQPKDRTPKSGGVSGATKGMRDPRFMSRNDMVDEIYQSAGMLQDLPQDFDRLRDDHLQSALRVVRGQGSEQDYQNMKLSAQQPREDYYNPLAGVIDPPGAYEKWVPPATGYNPSEVMYGAPKSLAALPAYPAAMGIAEAPKIQKASKQPKPLTGTLSPGWQSADQFDGPLFSVGGTSRDIPQYGSQLAKDWGVDNQSIKPSSSFDHWGTGPIEAGQTHAQLTTQLSPAKQAVVKGYQKLQQSNPVMAEFLARSFM